MAFVELMITPAKGEMTKSMMLVTSMTMLDSTNGNWTASVRNTVRYAVSIPVIIAKNRFPIPQ